MVKEKDFEIGNFRNFWMSINLTLTMDWVIRQIVVYHS